MRRLLLAGVAAAALLWAAGERHGLVAAVFPFPVFSPSAAAVSTVAFDAFSKDVSLPAGNLSWTHTPTGTPRGVIVWILGTGNSDPVTGVTYGGVAMTEVSASPLLTTTGEGHNVHCFFLGASIPTGAQTVLVSTTGSNVKLGYCITVTASADTAVQDSKQLLVNTEASPSVTLALGGNTCFCAIAIRHDINAPSGLSANAGWTERSEDDVGAQSTACYSYNTVSNADVAAGFNNSSLDQAACIAVAIT